MKTRPLTDPIPEGRKTVSRLPRQGITSKGTIETVPDEILLSLAGRVPEDLAFATKRV
tara:strand:- start:394 stop:567 length:174 start_codon:yes stop_codon:yes gene_type:complete